MNGETLTRLTLDPANEQYAVWAADDRVIFSSQRAGPSNLFWQAADGTGTAEQLTKSPNSQFPMAVSPDGTRLVFREDRNSGSNADLMILPLQGERRPQPLVQTSFNEMNGEISADGQWLAYQSNESGRHEIYVRPFPNVNDSRWQVSTGGGRQPSWARGGRELFYITPTGDALMAAEVSVGPVFKAGTPRKLLDTSAYYFPVTAGTLGSPGRQYDVSPDGRRFVMLKAAAGAQQSVAPASVTVVENWTEELKRRVPTP